MGQPALHVLDRFFVGVLYDLSCRVGQTLASASEDAGPADGVAIVEDNAVRPNRDTCQEAVFYHISRGEGNHESAT